jgi:hypothetical protein
VIKVENPELFLNPQIKKYDDLEGNDLITEMKRFLETFPNALVCFGCHSHNMQPLDMTTINWNHKEDITFLCPNCGTSFSVDFAGKFIRHYCITKGFTDLKRIERV